MVQPAHEIDLPAATSAAEPAPIDGDDDSPLTVIGPTAGWQALHLGEVWRCRELLFFLAWRDIKVRYKQTLLGAAWAILQPTLMMIVFTVVFGRLAGGSLGQLPYPLFVYAGLVAWTFFSVAMTGAGQSVVASERLITKVYFPRLAIPFAAVGAALVDFALAGSVLALLAIYYGIGPGWSVVLLPAAVILLMLLALGVGTLLAALNVAYRDVRHVLPFIVQLWLFATPSIYLAPAEPTAPAVVAESVSAVPAGEAAETGTAKLAWWLNLNPLNGAVALFRTAALGTPLAWWQWAYPALLAPTLFVVGCYYFRRVEDSFADVI